MDEAQRQIWEWSEEVRNASLPPQSERVGSSAAMPDEIPRPATPGSEAEHQDAGEAAGPPPNRRKYRPRTCRICLDTVEPTFPAAGDTTALGMLGLNRPEKPVWQSPPPDGRLISPCICKGSQKYVHEGCLQMWRAQNPMNDSNYLQCPTCKFKYRMSRVGWARWVNNKALQLLLTLLIMAVLLFLLGFIADPLLNLWLDPMDTFSDAIFGSDVAAEPIGSLTGSSWSDHFLKGFAAMGVAGFSQGFFRVTPWSWATRVRGQRRRGGRDRVEDVGLVVIILGTMTFMGAVWKFVRLYVIESLQEVANRVLEVQGEDDDEVEADPPAAENPTTNQEQRG